MKPTEINPGDIFGWLTIIERVENSSHGDAMYKCKCVCGNECIRRASILKYTQVRGYRSSCGCSKQKRRNISDYSDMPYQFDNMTGSMNL